MAISTHTPPAGPRKALFVVPQPQRADASPPRPQALTVPTSHLNVDQYVGLLACIERDGGVTTLQDISRTLPAVERPVSAVFDLCDAGILGVDLEGALDENLRVWRIDL